MVEYNKKLYVFGGAGPYIKQIKMRLGYNDVWLYDTRKDTWE